MDEQVDLLPLPDSPRIVLQRSPLVLALCQVRFSSILGVADPKFVAPFQQAIQARYPVTTQSQAIGLQFGLGPGQAELRQSSPGLLWRFADRTDTWHVVLAQDSIAIETRIYDRFEDFLERLREVLNALAEHIRPAVVSRIGLRYIDEIRPEGMTWSEAIRGQLLGPLGDTAFVRNAVEIAAVQQLLLRYERGRGVTIHHGLVPGGSTVKMRQGEEPPEGPFYLLDCDVYREFPLQEAMSMDADGVCQQVDAFHETSTRFFRWSVTEQYLSTLGRRNHGTS